MNDGKYYRCRQCKNKTLYVEEKDNKIVGNCETCGYNFIKPKKATKGTGQGIPIFNIVNKYSWLLVIIAILIAITTYSVNDNRIIDVNKNLINIKENQSNRIEELNNTLYAINEKTNNIKQDADYALGKIEALQNDAGTFYDEINVVKNNLNKINENITNIITDIASISNDNINDIIDCNIDVTYFNLTTDERYGIFNVSVDCDIDIEDVKFYINYTRVNVTLKNASGHPQEYQYLNNEYNDNYLLTWFGQTDYYTASFNISWDAGVYNTTELDQAKYIIVLMVNNKLVEIPTTWSVDIVD